MLSAAFNTGLDFHLLDHIAPLAVLKNMPLITTEELNFKLAQKFYPQVDVRLVPDLEFCLGKIAQEFSTFYECKYWAPHLKALLKQLYNQNIELVFCPHGQSDKGYEAPLLAPYALQDKVLLYGSLMKEMLKELKIWSQIAKYEIVGNYRFTFYKKYQTFYDNLAKETIFSALKQDQRTLLYAPTWRDADQASSFFDFGAKIIQELPADWNLIVKLHPLLEQRDPAYFYSITALIERKPNAILVQEFPPVYPILAKVDAYLGDFSSVGYDFLTFQKPMFFLPSLKPARLRRCGHTIDPSISLYKQFEMPNKYVKEQKELYERAFH